MSSISNLSKGIRISFDVVRMVVTWNEYMESTRKKSSNATKVDQVAQASFFFCMIADIACVVAGSKFEPELAVKVGIALTDTTKTVTHIVATKEKFSLPDIVNPLLTLAIHSGNIASVLVCNKPDWCFGFEKYIKDAAPVANVIVTLGRERNVMAQGASWLDRKISWPIGKILRKLALKVSDHFVPPPRQLPDEEGLFFFDWLRGLSLERYICPLSGKFIIRPVHHKEHRQLIVDKASLDLAQKQKNTSVTIKEKTFPLSSFESRVDTDEEIISRKVFETLQKALICQKNVAVTLKSFLDWQEQFYDELSLFSEISNAKLRDPRSRLPFFLQFIQEEYRDAPEFICPFSQKFLLHPIAHKEEIGLFINQEVLLNARAKGQQTIVIKGKEYSLSSFEGDIQPKNSCINLIVYAAFWERFMATVVGRSQLMYDTVLMTKPEALQEIPLSFCEEGSIAKPKCAITGRAICHFRAPINPNGTKEEKKIIYEKTALERWCNGHPNIPPPRWPKNIPFDNDHIQTPELWQTDRDSTLEDLAVQARINVMKWKERNTVRTTAET